MDPGEASHPVSRAEFVIRPLKSLPRMSIKLSSIYYCHYSFSSFRTPICSEIYHALVKLSIVSSAPPITTSVAPPCLTATVGVFSKFRVLGGKFYQG